MTGDGATTRVVEVLNDLGIPFMLTGSFATSHYAVPRSSQDADFVVELGGQSIFEVARRLGPEFRLDPQMAFETTTGTKHHDFELLDGSFRIELFYLGEDPHDQARFRRRVRVSFHGRHAFLPTLEDVLITKLHWFQIGRRPKDRADIREVLAVNLTNDSVDWPYIHSWCDQHGTRELLDRRTPPVGPADLI